MRTSSPPWLDARAPNQLNGLVCTDQSYPRVALDANDLWISCVAAQHPEESYRQSARRGHLGYPSGHTVAPAGRTAVRTFEQRAIVYHDWGRLNLTFNFISETSLQGGRNDFGYAWGVFRQAAYRAMVPDKNMAGMPGMDKTGMEKTKVPPLLSSQRLGYGIEMIGALGNTDRFGFDGSVFPSQVGTLIRNRKRLDLLE